MVNAMNRRIFDMTLVAATLALVPVARAADPNVPGEPAIPADPDANPPRNYGQTPGAHAERPGKHSTTAGRHGTSGQRGGGVNTQSGSEAAPREHPSVEQGEGSGGD